MEENLRRLLVQLLQSHRDQLDALMNTLLAIEALFPGLSKEKIYCILHEQEMDLINTAHDLADYVAHTSTDYTKE